MYIYFEDWSQEFWIDQLTAKRRAHAGRLIKAITLPVDPRVRTGNMDLKVFEVDGCTRFHDEIFEYDDRGFYLGVDLEAKLDRVNSLNSQSTRSLFRLAHNILHSDEVAMSLKKAENGEWLIQHPLELIDGYNDSILNPSIRSLNQHLDIFSPVTIGRLHKIVNINEGSRETIEPISGAKLRQEVLSEINIGLSLERK